MTILIEKRAQKFIRKQDLKARKRLLEAINQLPRGDTKQLSGHGGEFYRLRVGTYRVIYSYENENIVIRVLDVGNRGSIYNRF